MNGVSGAGRVGAFVVGDVGLVVCAGGALAGVGLIEFN